MHRYVNKFTSCHNIRDLDIVDQMSAPAQDMVRKRQGYKDLIADNGLPSGTRSA